MAKIILIVDDEPAILGLMKRRLELYGYQVVTSETGQGAVDAIQHVKPKYEAPLLAVLLDLGLKDMGGLEVLKQIKEIQPSLPVIVVTGCHDENEARRAIELGALDYVTKPVNFEYLKNVLSAQSSD